MRGDQKGWCSVTDEKNGIPVSFVAHPELAPTAENCVYARPDDASDQGGTWRERLLAYNRTRNDNPLGLLPAFQLYKNPIYAKLVARFGTENTYILSAGWGLINTAFLTPTYDITFSASAESFVRRRRGNIYRDLSMLPDDTKLPLVFFGGKEYAPLFAALTRSTKSEKTVFYNSSQPPLAPGCALKRFVTRTKTNWQYECAAAFLAGKFAV